jgi:simple sugar transport system permease protein
VVAIAFAIGVWLFLRRSVFGYEMSIIGSSPRAATYAGMPTRRIILLVFALGGVAAGLAGLIEMLTNVQRFGPALSNNLGYTGVVVAVLAGGFGPELIAMALVFAVIAVAGNVLSITGAPSELVFAMYGLTLICAAIGQGLRHVRIVNPGRAGSDTTTPVAVEGAR